MSYHQDIQDRIQVIINNLSEDFSIDKLSKSPARFNLKKLQWFNQEYIKRLPLKEFVFRALENQVKSKKAEGRVREGCYVYLVDFGNNQIYVQDGYGALGGGMDQGENEIECLIREIQEETNNQLTIDPKKLVKVDTYDVTQGWGEYDGKRCNLYFYPVSAEELEPWQELDEWKSEQAGEKVYNDFGWQDLTTFFEQNTYYPFALFDEFCRNNNLTHLQVSPAIVRQHLAYRLDQNRISLLSELGTESVCILDYKQASQEDIKWKKSDVETSLEALKTISDFAFSKSLWGEFYEKIKKEFDLERNEWGDLLLEIYNQDKLGEYHDFATQFFDERIKNWLNENELDFGLHLWTLRLALTGKRRSPSPFEVMPILGLEECKKRVEDCL